MKCVQIFCLILNLVGWFSFCILINPIYVAEINPLSDERSVKFLPSLWLVFSFKEQEFLILRSPIYQSFMDCAFDGVI